MRIVIYGVGAIGGTLAVMLKKHGTDVVGIARGAQLDAIRADGLLLRTPEGDHRQSFTCVADPSEIAFRPDDVIFLTMKTQDTQAALERLRAVGVREQPIFCMQNGVANEDLALRLFDNVYGVVVAMPTTFIKPGEVVDSFAPKLGVFDIGRHGAGADTMSAPIADLLNRSGFAAFVQAGIMPFKYAKLLTNLANAIDAVLGQSPERLPYMAAARAEAMAVFEKAGIVPADLDRDGRLALADMRDVPGAERVGSSSAQSLARGAGSIETDYLNGEIVYMGRRLGVPTPVNAYFADRAQAMVRDRSAVGSAVLADIEKALPGVK